MRSIQRFLHIGALALGAWMLPVTGEATLVCGPTDRPGIERCQAGLPPASAQQLHETQRASEWCWAASIAMMLRHHGVSVAQEEVVRAYWGTATNLGVPMRDLSNLLKRTWRDTAGQAYAASVSDLHGAAQGVGDVRVLQDLQEGRPLIVGTVRHAMLLVQVTYERNELEPQAEVRVIAATVLDPAPGAGLRALHPGERTPRYLTRVHAGRSDAELAVAVVNPASPGLR